MPLQQYVRQVKPRNESYTPPVEKIQSFLTEATDFSTAMENVIGAAYAAASFSNSKDGENYLKKEWLNHSDFNKTKSVHNKNVANIMKFGAKIKAQLRGGNGSFEIQTKGQQTDDWKKWKGRGGRDTSKTDIVIGGKQCSVKNASGAQLMSGKKGESIATTCAASEASGLDGDATGAILQSINELESVLTEGYFASVDNLKQLKKHGGGQKLVDWARNEVDAYEKALAAWESTEGALKKDMPKKPTEEVIRIATDKPVKIKAGEFKGKTMKPSEFPTEISGINADFLENIDKTFDKNAEEVKEKLSAAFKGKPDFKLAFVYEAATGTRKFGGGAIQKAEHLLSWEKKSGIQNFKVNVYPVKSRTHKIIKTYASQIDLQVNWKSSSTASHAGYNAYQNVRLGLKKLMDDTEESMEESYKVIGNYRQQLNEGYLSEFAFWDKVKEVTKQFVNKAKQLWDSFVTWLKMVVEKIKAAAQDGLKALSNIMGFDLDTDDTLRNNKSLKLR